MGCAGQGRAGRCLLLGAACLGCVESVAVGGWRLTSLGEMDFASDSGKDLTCAPLLCCYVATMLLRRKIQAEIENVLPYPILSYPRFALGPRPRPKPLVVF